MTTLALFDMDGTLSDDSHRHALYIAGEHSFYWDYNLMMDDPVYPIAQDIYRQQRVAGWDVGILTARQDIYHNRRATTAWLGKNNLTMSPVFLRPDQSTLPESARMSPVEFKTHIMKRLVDSHKWNRVVLYENDIDVVHSITSELGDQHVMYCVWDQMGKIA